MDGGALYSYLAADPGHHAYDGVAGIAPGEHTAIDAGRPVPGLVRRLLLQPPPVTTRGTRRSWSTGSALGAAPPPAAPRRSTGPATTTRAGWTGTAWTSTPGAGLGRCRLGVTGLPPDAPTMIPVPVSFAGMPNTRWWAFEDGKTNFGDIDAATTDLAKLMFLEFALVYSNDWFVIP